MIPKGLRVIPLQGAIEILLSNIAIAILEKLIIGWQHNHFFF